MRIGENKTITNLYSSNTTAKNTNNALSKTDSSFKDTLNTTKAVQNDKTKDLALKDRNKSNNSVKDNDCKEENKIQNADNVSKEDEKVEVTETEEEEVVVGEAVEKEETLEIPVKELLQLLLTIIDEGKVSEEDSKKVIEALSKYDILTSIETLETGKEKNTSLNDILEQFTKMLKDNDVVLNENEQQVLTKILNKIDSQAAENDTKNSIKDLLMQISNKENSNEIKPEKNVESSMEDETADFHNEYEDNSDDDFLNKLVNKNNDTTSQNINTFAARVSFNQHASVQNNAAVDTSINASKLADDLIKDVKLMITDSIKELTVKVNPNNLGQITITLTEENGVMKANLKADSREGAELLIQNSAEIRKQLDSQNIKIQEVNVEVYQEDTTFYKQGMFSNNFEEQQEKANKSGKTEGIENDSSNEEDEQSNMAEEDNNLDLLA